MHTYRRVVDSAVTEYTTEQPCVANGFIVCLHHWLVLQPSASRGTVLWEEPLFVCKGAVCN